MKESMFTWYMAPEANLGYTESEAFTILEAFFKKKNTQFWLSNQSKYLFRMRKEITLLKTPTNQ